MQKPRKDFVPGQDAATFTAADYNALADYIEALAGLRVVAPLSLKDGVGGRTLQFLYPRGFWARVIGPKSPYGFTQLIRTAPAAFQDDGGGYAGPEHPSILDLTAYEVNDVRSLDGTVQWLVPGWSNDFRFQDIASGPGSSDNPPCSVTVHLQERSSGDPISGAEVTVSGYPADPGPTSVSGSTDSNGDYTPPDVELGMALTLTVVYEGVTYTEGLTTADCPEIVLCWCKAIINVNYEPPDADLFIGLDATVSSPGTAIGSDVLAAQPGWTRTGSAGAWTFTARSLTRCSSASIIGYAGASVSVAANKTGWISAGSCTNQVLPCGGEITFDFALYQFTPCYLAWESPPFSGEVSDPDYRGLGCYSEGECEEFEGPDKAGLTPKKLDVRLTTIGTNPAGCVLFGDDDGEWIEDIEITSNQLFPATGLHRERFITWSTGCLVGGGNYISQPGSHRNCPAPYETSRTYFGSRSIRVEASCGDGSGFVRLVYDFWVNADCTDPGGTTHQFVEIPITTDFQAILDYTLEVWLTGPGAVETLGYRVEVRESPC